MIGDMKVVVIVIDVVFVVVVADEDVFWCDFFGE